MTEQVDLDALEAIAKAATPGPWKAGRYHVLADADLEPITYRATVADIRFIAAADPSTVLALIAELRQERERAEHFREGVRVFGEQIRDMGIAEFKQSRALSRAEETIDAVRAARANHPECDKVPDGISCGWKRAVQDIDATLTEYGKQKEGDRGDR